MIRHFKRWNKWRKRCANGWTYKFAVLIGFVHSPTFALVLTDEDEQAYWKMMRKALRDDELT